MDAKDLRIETALDAHNNDGSAKYAQGGTALQSNGNKSYHNIGTNSLAKVDGPSARPCAIIGPDRVVPPQSTSDVYLKKLPVEPWPCTDKVYQHPPDYHKPTEHPPPRNISPRQTFQENMQRIMVPPTYASVKSNEDRALKSSKIMPSEAKYCDVPYTISPINNEQKVTKSSEGLVLNNSSAYTQHMPPNNWSGSSVNVRPLRSYGAPELYQYSEYPNCPAPRPITMIRPHRNAHEDMPQVYQDRFYPETNIRFKPYPIAKERPHQLPQARYDYIANYPNAFHLHSPYTPQKYDLQKLMPPHPCPVYQPVPLKYLDRRMPAPNMERYQRSPSQQVNFNPPFCNQNIPPNYGSVPGNCLPNRAYPYTPNPPTKPLIQNRVYFENPNTRKYFPNSENMYINDVNQLQAIKNDLLYQTYPPINIHSLSPHHMYRKENSIKGYEQANHFRNIEYASNMNALSRLPLQFSPQTISISPDSNTSHDTTQILSNGQEDCGYVSQSSTASVKSMESGVNRLSGDMYQRHDMRYDTIPHFNIPGQKIDSNMSSKDKKGLDVRQFLQMWNEGDEGNDNNKETATKMDSSDSSSNNQNIHQDPDKNEEQLYVLDLVNVPKEELCKYEHIQKISKLPENIKGYNNIELLNQYEKLVESPGTNHFALTQPAKQTKDLNVSLRNMARQRIEVQPRPISPLDVEAKISQSVIHKEVGCNFEIRPCSPQMLNVEVATPINNVLGERLIEKLVNPNIAKSTMVHRIDESNNDTLRNSAKVQSCKLVNNQYPSSNMSDSLKTNYCLQDLESNSGICLASLPRLDNDIELNFPEINQQFINANKIDSIKGTSIQDLPILDTENTSNVHESKNNILSKPFIIEHLNSGSESDKEVSKLSKYRKHKKNSSTTEIIEIDVSSTQHMSLNRTDSVIIKNPENTKSNVEYLNVALKNNKSDSGNTTQPKVLPKDDGINENFDHTFNETMNGKFNYYISTDISDTAIDFSLNKSDEQGNYITSINNLNESLQNRIDTSQHIFSESETVSFGSSVSKINSPKELNKSLASTEFTISQPHSPMFDNFICSSTLSSNNKIDEDYALKQVNTVALDDKIDFKSIDENNLMNKKDVAQSNSEVKLLSSVLEEEEIVPQHNLPITCNDTEKFSKLVKSYEQINKSGYDDKIDFKLNEDNLVGKIDVTHLNSEEILIETSSASEHIIPQNNLSTSCLDTQNVLKNMKSSDNITSRRLSLSNDIENQILTNYLVAEKNPPETHEPYKLDSVAKVSLTDQNGVKKMSMENEFGSEFKSNDFTINVVDDNVASTSLDKIKSPDNENIQKILSEETQQVTNVLDINAGKEKDISTTEIKTFIPTLDKDENNICASLESSLNDAVEDLNTISEEVITDIKNMKNCTNKYEVNCNKTTTTSSGTNSNPEITVIENKSELDTVNAMNTLDECSTEKICDTSFSYRTKSDFFFKKELFSPWIQNLLINNNGFCISSIIFEKKSLPQMFDNYSFKNNHKSLINEDEESKTLQLSVVEKQSYDQAPIMITDININRNECEATENTTSKVELMLNEESRDCELQNNKNNIELNNVEENETLLKNFNENNFIRENSVIEIFSSELSFEHQNIEIETQNDIDANVKVNDNYKEVLPLIEKSKKQYFNRRSRSLKRSLSESAVTEYTAAADSYKDNFENDFMFATKRAKIDNSDILVESHILANNFTSFIQSNRRNSISTVYNDENVFCILIDNDCVLAEENSTSQKICYTEIPGDCLSTINADAVSSEITEIITSDSLEQYSNEFIVDNIDNKSIDETWVDDVACMETVFNDDIAEDIVISGPSSPKGSSSSSEDESDNIDSVYNVSKNEHANKIKYIYGNQMCDNDVQLVEKLYRTPQMDVNKTLIDRESPHTDECNRYYDNESLEKILSDSNTVYDIFSLAHNDTSIVLPNCNKLQGDKENSKDPPKQGTPSTVDLSKVVQTKLFHPKESKKFDDINVHSCGYSDNFVTYKKEESFRNAISSSPEVSSTTSEDKNSAILLKIRSYKGTKISEINEMGASFRQSQSQRCNNTNYSSCTSRPLLTKAAQKYIPPLKETIHDLKVKLHLPKQSLYKLQQLKKSKEEPKINASVNKLYSKSSLQNNPKKIKFKPKFEDVLKSIDEIQFKMHKEKHRKMKSIPKVIIKKNENGAHYASTQSKETFNPDLTGRKWQPWVFLEKSNFIDKMAIKQKFKAIYSHRKNTYVLAENFRKYKSITSSKFVISHPKSSDNLSSGKLKYTFKLKHN